MMFVQKESKYIKEDGIFKIVYTVELSKACWNKVFTDDSVMWEVILDCRKYKLSEDRRCITWSLDQAHPKQRAVRYTNKELEFIFSECLTPRIRTL